MWEAGAGWVRAAAAAAVVVVLAAVVRLVSRVVEAGCGAGGRRVQTLGLRVVGRTLEVAVRAGCAVTRWGAQGPQRGRRNHA